MEACLNAAKKLVPQHISQPSNHKGTTVSNLTLSQLPAIGAPLEGGSFAGITTQPDGTHCAVVLLPAHGTDLDWSAAKAWAADQGGELPSRPVAALLFANVKAQLRPEWHWTADEYSASYAWNCDFYDGYQGDLPKSDGGGAVAVRLIHLTA